MNLAMDAPFDLRDATIALIGRLGRVPRHRLAAALQARNATIARRIGRQTAVVAVAHGAVALLRSGRLAEILAQADTRGLPVVSEHGLLRRLDLLPPAAPEPRHHRLRELASWAALNPATARLLALFDIIEEVEGRYGFRDLKAARDFARHLAEHDDLPAALESALEARRRYGFRHFAATPLGATDDQIRLDLGDETESFEAVWERALDAEASHDYAAAEAAYRRCVAMRPRDSACLLHLGEIVAALDRREEARELLRRATALQSDFAEAWFSLSLLETGSAARDCLTRALQADPDFIEAVHELALLEMKEGAYDRALPLWERYLVLAPRSSSPCADRPSVARARRALMLCRMAQLQARVGGEPAH